MPGGDAEDKALEADGEDPNSVTEETGDRPQVADATWLSDSLLLVVGRTDVGRARLARRSLPTRSRSRSTSVRINVLVRGTAPTERTVLTAAVGEALDAAANRGTLSIEGDPSSRSPDLGSIVGEHLTGLRDRAAMRTLEFISTAPSAHGLSDERDLVLSSRLHILRNALRPQLPAVVIEGDQAAEREHRRARPDRRLHVLRQGLDA